MTIDVLARGIAMLQRLQTDYERTQKEEIDDRELFQEVRKFAGDENDAAAAESLPP